ncbi:glycosyltransferase [Butyrivibrio sp. FC2001]|uniref:glycosyltransferase n=1 Tax=Butyrivibrio sp. FC2001 TaxID=1280671 RepID=UPI0018CB7890|nr:glycosyltransferase [Butyrivibrio sp. FC2001]
MQHIITENEICNDINDYLNYFDSDTWQKYTGISSWVRETDIAGETGYLPAEINSVRDVSMALNICTYHRVNQIKSNIARLLTMKFFNPDEADYYGHLHVFIVDNGAELEQVNNDFFRVVHNVNTGGSGGFQKGLEEIRASHNKFTHVIFMDDDADFLPETFYRLFALLTYMKPKHYYRSVAGRMFCLDQPSVQYTAAEVWNNSNLMHVGFMQDMKGDSFESINEPMDAEYGGWWFCCYPYDFCKDNDVVPFFLHCDDVEYGLRFLNSGGGSPIILNGIQVWHETAVYRQNSIIQYYDLRNPLYVNEKYNLWNSRKEEYEWWFNKISCFHALGDYMAEYYGILGMADYLKGIDYLNGLDSEKYHKKLSKLSGNRYKNAVLWRIVTWLYWKKKREKEKRFLVVRATNNL